MNFEYMYCLCLLLFEIDFYLEFVIGKSTGHLRGMPPSRYSDRGGNSWGHYLKRPKKLVNVKFLQNPTSEADVWYVISWRIVINM